MFIKDHKKQQNPSKNCDNHEFCQRNDSNEKFKQNTIKDCKKKKEFFKKVQI